MTQPDEPYHAPDEPSESSLWRGIGVVALLIVAAFVVWWAIELAGDPATRDLDEPETEPLEPSQIEPAPIFPEPDPVVIAA
ncbi:MAG: hypothetical protein KY397_05700 [Gemmatimonadetes bacterium]|nr:hypothetical protein [Gemmatimonadota bacterium]